ncbi:fatty acid desaturase [Mesorhizobium sp. M1C.F.Ca.ET.193.01.1.1]|uniref:fatty acid desaturase n=1 Tax=unclassified Mesorhizobium TaxID=325217 RepID=UPI000FD42222|nr:MULTISPECIES: fatty acid desaturase [unclassified Mesorhizobium]TGT01479.1 fatty acid desaturase [bacterium M00.F.Ca.ET.177.01.1.1]TGQ54239.1 fatty acid desaturase [Mesorhizobium sp. M1C.F.Ca.ET.210.01.1.1]TGQ72252.1 fatty acid desaturase [Mesorhizobium sp. M1C.F.Ca.ET.212.01.1.1]TGR10068.1 fatty acid desaturase [Mesorhizobium sp. M1C.F.Ca.ET.204.01.1.1]TGR30188.1 fatty acid desaturase [Mesorhizobium sp. M1C.F.Ca.ET.196.01.1.1]
MTGMNKRRSSAPAVEWPTVFLALFCYGAWLAAGFLLWPSYPLLALAALALILALQSSLMHEVLHGHPTRNARINEAFVFLPIGMVWPFRRFKTIHLRHHADERLTDPLDDPESYYQALWMHEEMPPTMRLLLKLNNTMVGRLILGPWLSSIGFFIDDARQIAAGDKAIRNAWLLHALGIAVAVSIVTLGFGIPLWLYVLVPVWVGQSLISIRTYAEHQWSEHPEGRTIIVERSPLSFLFLNNNLHFVHHKSPTVAWYKLPKMFRDRREEWLRMNNGYVYPNYLALIKSFAFKAKEPVVHPVLRRAPEPGRAFKPRVRARNVNGLGTAPVPAEPPKE